MCLTSDSPWDGSRLGLVGDLLSRLVAAGRIRIVVPVIEFFLQFPLLLRRLRRIHGRFRRIVALFHGGRVDGSLCR